MAEKKISRKELLKEPDEFLTLSAQTIAYVRDNPQRVAFGALIVILSVAAVLGYLWYQKQQALWAHEQFQKALNNYEATMYAPTPPTDEKLNQLFNEFNRLAQDFSSLPPGEMALLYSGHVMYKKKDYKAALERYEKMKSASVLRKGLEPLVLYHTADTLFRLADYDKALAIFGQLTKETNSPYRREAYAFIARIYETTNRNKEAVQAYRQYLKIFPEAPDAAFVKARIADLASQG